MPKQDGTEPIEDDEILFRRIPVSTNWYHKESEHPPSPKAFQPNRNDVTGISLFREKYKSVIEAAQGWPGKSYYVATLRAGDLRKHGIEVVPDVADAEPGHATIPAMNAETRKSITVEERMLLLANHLCISVEGPFESSPDPEADSPQ